VNAQGSLTFGSFDTLNGDSHRVVVTLSELDSDVRIIGSLSHDRLTVLPEFPTDCIEERSCG
jgi:hypothetical protein